VNVSTTRRRVELSCVAIKGAFSYGCIPWLWLTAKAWRSDDDIMRVILFANLNNKHHKIISLLHKVTRNAFCGTRVCLPLPKFREKTIPMQNVTEIGQSTAEYCQAKRFSIWRPSAILNFKKSHLVTWLCTEFHRNRMIFHWDMAINDFQDGDRPILNFRNWQFLSLDH